MIPPLPAGSSRGASGDSMVRLARPTTGRPTDARWSPATKPSPSRRASTAPGPREGDTCRRIPVAAAGTTGLVGLSSPAGRVGTSGSGSGSGSGGDEAARAWSRRIRTSAPKDTADTVPSALVATSPPCVNVPTGSSPQAHNRKRASAHRRLPGPAGVCMRAFRSWALPGLHCSACRATHPHPPLQTPRTRTPAARPGFFAACYAAEPGWCWWVPAR